MTEQLDCVGEIFYFNIHAEIIVARFSRETEPIGYMCVCVCVSVCVCVYGERERKGDI